ncbi:MAG TPA: NnrS family protein [Stellaceae bacterium]|jgi:uncharacterized protein involved in response to NO|nr:NnrS family protein [Stellaceae bacterium]
MSISRAASADRPVPSLLSFGFRPFFLVAALWSALAIGLWIAMLTTGLVFPSRFDPLTWHIHEMLFGFVMAAIGGFLLTAVPNWTGRPPLRGWPLGALAALWLWGRVACLVSAMLPAWFVIASDLAFSAGLLLFLAGEILAARNWRNLPMMLPIAVLGGANLVMHLESLGVDLPPGLGWRLGLAAIIILISAVAGRIVPSFTRNWLTKRGSSALPKPSGWVDRAALTSLHTGLLGWALLPDSRVTGALLLCGGVLNLARLLRWRGAATLSEPLLAALHLGYAWLAIGAALLGLSAIAPAVPQSAAIHALTAGAIGTMILAVMTRATRGHTGQALAADRVTTAIYGLVNLAAIARVLAAFATAWASALLMASAILWMLAFAVFALAYGPMLIHPLQNKIRQPATGQRKRPTSALG